MTKKGGTTTKVLDYFSILKNSFSIVRKNRFLWVLGAMVGGGFANFNFTGGDIGSFTGENGADNDILNGSQVWEKISNWVHANWEVVLGVGVFIVLLLVIFMALSVMARAGQIHAVDSISQDKKSSFMEAMKFGWHKFWRVLGVSVLIGLIIFGIFVVLAIPAAVLWFVMPLFIVYIILAVLLMIPAVVVLGIIYEYSLRYIVLGDERAVQSIKSGYRLLRDRGKETFLVWLVTVGTMMVAGIVFVLIILFALITLFLLGALMFILNVVAGVVYTIAAVTLFVLLLFLASGFISSLISAYWTLIFKELNK